MIRRIVAFVLVCWILGFLWFAVTLPEPLPDSRTDVIVVPTGGGGRIARGLELLEAGAASEMLVSGVHEDVKPGEFAAEYDVPMHLMECCLTLGFAAIDTRGNARETAEWASARDVRTVRLVTSDWHMRRAALELEGALPAGTEIMRDSVRTQPSLWILLLEYHKFMASWFSRVAPI